MTLPCIYICQCLQWMLEQIWLSKGRNNLSFTFWHNCHGECLKGGTSTLDFDDPNGVNLAVMEPSVQIKANTDRDEQIAGPFSKKWSEVDLFCVNIFPFNICSIIYFVHVLHLTCHVFFLLEFLKFIWN